VAIETIKGPLGREETKTPFISDDKAGCIARYFDNIGLGHARLFAVTTGERVTF